MTTDKKELALVQPQNKTGLAMIHNLSLSQVASAIASSGFFEDSTETSKAIVKMLAGAELGIPPIQSMMGVYIVKGRVTLSYTMIAALIKKSGKYRFEIKELTETKAILKFFELIQPDNKWVEMGDSSFSIDDAKQAGIYKPGSPWDKFPRNMVFARAMTNAAKWYCSDVFGGPIYSPDEIDSNISIDPETGEPINYVEDLGWDAAPPTFDQFCDRLGSLGYSKPRVVKLLRKLGFSGFVAKNANAMLNKIVAYNPPTDRQLKEMLMDVDKAELAKWKESNTNEDLELYSIQAIESLLTKLSTEIAEVVE